MGSEARIVFSGAEEGLAQRAAARVAVEIERLEDALSLYRPQSEICRLNREGKLSAPSADFRRCLSLALATAQATNGLFDPTVQALWEAYADWFVKDSRAEAIPEPALAEAVARVDWRRIMMRSDAVALGQGQRITLNGLGQGYVTDRIADQLRALGYRHVFVDLGEQRALGAQADGAPWIAARRGGGGPIGLTDGALATSEGEGCVLSVSQGVHHLFDPRSGRSPRRWRRVTVRNAQAAVADALSTALYVAEAGDIPGIIDRFPGVTVWTTAEDNTERVWRAKER